MNPASFRSQIFPMFPGRCLLLTAALLCSAQKAPVPSPEMAPTGTLKGWYVLLSSADIGNPAIAGSAKSIPGGLQVTAGGKDIWGFTDQFRFTYEKRAGDFDVAVRVESLAAPHLYTRAGIMARADLSPGSRHVIFLVFPDNRPRHNNTSAYELQYRETNDGDSKAIYPPHEAGTPPMFPVEFPDAWLRLKREGNQFTGFVSTDGEHWKKYSSYSLDLPDTILLGLAVTSHTAEASTTATFGNLRVIHDN